MGDTDDSLFVTEHAKGRLAYRLYAATIFAGIWTILYYRVTHVPDTLQDGRLAWIGLSLAELWYALYWILTQSIRWNPVYRRTFKDKLSLRYEDKLPNVDIFACTADPYAEPPSLVVSTVLSHMSYNYPTENMNVYLSDDGGSILTFYAMWEASQFAKYWLPFCKRFKIEPRSPLAFFSSLNGPRDEVYSKEWLSIKNLYDEMNGRIDGVVELGKVPEEMKENHKGFSRWTDEMTKKNHPSIVKVLIDGKDANAIDSEGNKLPTLVYMAREKRPQHPHNFKAGAMNSLIRVSALISNSPIILNVDCDMYSNNSDSIRDALCFFLDEEGHDIAFVQYPQNYNNMTKNDTYGDSPSLINEVDLCGLDSWGGPPYIGTGCFNRRESLCGKSYTKNYTEDWRGRSQRTSNDDINKLEKNAKSLCTSTCELNTLWGHEVGLKYDCPVEDVITGLIIQCRGWRSMYFNPKQKAFLGVGPTTLAQIILQHQRWSEGNFQIFLSKYCTFLFGHGKIKLGLQMGYCIYGLWAPNSIPTIYYTLVPSLCLLKGISLFPKMTSLWFIPFAYVMIGKQIYSALEALMTKEITLKGWWNIQRMWLIKRQTSYLFGTVVSFMKILGLSEMRFQITDKVSDEENSKRYEKEIMEFDSSPLSLVMISSVALLNLASLVIGITNRDFERFCAQIVLCGAIMALNLAIYEGILVRKDKGSINWVVTIISVVAVVALSFLPIF